MHRTLVPLALLLTFASCTTSAPRPATSGAESSPSVTHASGDAPAAANDPVRRCGGVAGMPCSPEQYCDFGSDCDIPDALGTCRTRPEVCTREYRPVCGCDGHTYGNPCAAAAAGVSVRATGACTR